jgi:Tfp pilus assembly protein FimV
MPRARRRPSRERTSTLSRKRAAGTALRGRILALNAVAWTGAIVSTIGPAHAITLGEITVHSALGQSLHATVPVSLAAGEYLGSTCISAPQSPRADLGTIRQPRLQTPETGVPGTYDIRITTPRPLYEPMYELQLQIKCPGTPLLVRQYVLMLDLPGTLPAAAAAPAVSPVATLATPVDAERRVLAPTTARPMRTRRPAATGSPITAGSRYRVEQGDTLSTISARVQDRGGAGVWAFSERIFEANTTAFIGGNLDLIKLGAEIDIPTATPAAGGPMGPAIGTSGNAAAAPAISPPDPATASPPIVTAAIESAVAIGEPASSRTADASPFVAEIAAPPAGNVVEGRETRAAVNDSQRPTTDDAASPLSAVALGILVGLGLSLALLRQRLLDVFHDVRVRRAARGRPALSPAAAAPVRTAAPTRPQRMIAPLESAMVVVEEPPAETAENLILPEPTTRTAALRDIPPPYRPSASPEPETDLESLFDDDVARGVAEPLESAGDVAEAALDLDLGPAAITEDATVEQNWGSDTQLAPTRKAAAVPAAQNDPTAEKLDLHALASSADGDEQLSQTLMEALTLLERDYEDELTASQVVDLNKLREVAGDDDETDESIASTGTGPRKRR